MPAIRMGRSNVAVPSGRSGLLPMVVVPSMKLTVPVGMVPSAAVTVAVSMAVVPILTSGSRLPGS